MPRDVPKIRRVQGAARSEERSGANAETNAVKTCICVDETNKQGICSRRRRARMKSIVREYDETIDCVNYEKDGE